MSEHDRLDPVYDSDRITGSTPPESGPESSNVVGRPAEKAGAPFHDPAEAPEEERTPFDSDEALESGGSFDGLGLL